MLTDTKVKQLKPEEKVYRVADGNGLCIEVRPSGTKIWRLRYRWLGIAKTYTIGNYPEISLAYARQDTLKQRELLAKNIEPQANKKAAKLEALNNKNETFEQVSKEMLEKRKENKSKKWISNRTSYFERDIYPYIGNMVLSEINSQHVIFVLDKVLERIRSGIRKNKGGNIGTGEYAARQVKGFMGEVFQYGILTKGLTIDPTYVLRDYLEYPEHEHARPMEKHERIDIMKKIEKSGSSLSIKNAAKVLLYTMLRTIEVRRALKSYINWEDKTWTIPVASKKKLKAGKRNMKKNRIHIVPLSNQVIAILEEQFKIYPDSPLIFPGRGEGGLIGAGTINQLLKTSGFSELSPHDFRATSSTDLNEKNYDKDWIELQLAHVSGDQTRATYNHARWLDDRRKMLQWWADEVDSWG